jgi:hypothetical protein
VEIATSIAAYRRYLRDLVDAKARRPGDDLTSDLLAIHHEDPALEELARRYPRLHLADGQQLSFHPNISFRGPQELRVRTSPHEGPPESR